MARKYKTAKGRMIDMEAMRTANEKTVATGNMGVNAKGDEVKGGKVVKTAKERTVKRYQAVKQTGQASLKKPLESKETKVNPPEKAKPKQIKDAEMTTQTVRRRDDGSRYVEELSPDGDITIKELSPPNADIAKALKEEDIDGVAKEDKAPPVEKKTKKKSSKKKGSTKKKPTV
jgi:hypothetical protein